MVRTVVGDEVINMVHLSTHNSLDLFNVTVGQLLIGPPLSPRTRSPRTPAHFVHCVNIATLAGEAVVLVNRHGTTSSKELLTGPAPLVNLGSQQHATTNHRKALGGRQVLNRPIPVVPILMVTANGVDAQVVDARSLVNLVQKLLTVCQMSPKTEVSRNDDMLDVEFTSLVNGGDDILLDTVAVAL